MSARKSGVRQPIRDYLHRHLGGDGTAQRRNRRFALIGIAVLALAIAVYAAFHREPARLMGAAATGEFHLPYPVTAFYRQTKNNCGPYSTAGAIRVLEGGDVIKSEDVVSRMPLRVPGSFTMPQGIRWFLHGRGHDTATFDGTALSPADRLEFLRERLTLGQAVILLVGRSLWTTHYMLLLGFDRQRDVFFAYNSAVADGGDGRTVDGNGVDPGNQTWTSQKLLDYWRGGEVLGFYRWTAITASGAR